MTQERPHFPVRHSILDQDALAVWLGARYRLSGPVRCRFLRRSMSDAYRVEAGDRSYVLKVYMRGRHSREEIEAETDFMNDLIAHDVSLAAPIANGDGAYVNEMNAPEGTRYAVLFDAVTGEEPQETNLAHSRAFGQLAGRLHTCADRLGKAYDRWQLDGRYLIEEPLNQIRPYFQHRPADLQYLHALGEEWIAELHRRLPKQGPEYGMCHGDLHTGNARFDREGRLTLYDFDSCGYGWRAIDVGVYHVTYDWMDLGEETRREKARFWEAFVEGYNEERTLSSDELAVAQLCLPIRHLELMGLTMQYWASHAGIHWITDEYFDQHMAWFRRWADEYGMPCWIPRGRERRNE
ncbi:MAG: phosphotransferase enzyme family protein [Anaerolineae bacterium]